MTAYILSHICFVLSMTTWAAFSSSSLFEAKSKRTQIITRLLWWASFFYIPVSWFTDAIIYGVIANVALLSILVFWLIAKSESSDNVSWLSKHKKLAWPKVAVFSLVLALAHFDLSMRGPVEVEIVTSGNKQEHFYVSTFFGNPGGHGTSFSSYELSAMGSSKESIEIPRSYVQSPIRGFLSLTGTPWEILVSVQHPMYRPVDKRITVEYSLLHEATKVTIEMTHWDDFFEDAESKFDSLPDEAFEEMYRSVDFFRRSIGGLNDRVHKKSWYNFFNEYQIQKVKKLYLPFIQEKMKKYEQYHCSSQLRCKRNIELGKVREYENSDWPFN